MPCSDSMLVVLLSGFFLMCACSRQENNGFLSDHQIMQLQDAIKDNLKDPESAKFKWDKSTFDVNPQTGFGEVCVFVNAKNSYSGYAGFQTAYLNFFVQENTLSSIQIVGMGDDRTRNNCNEVRSNIIRIKHHDPRITEGQARAGCSIMEDGKLFCASPGTGMCWRKGHNPWKGEEPEAIDIGTSRSSPDYNHPEHCG